MTDLVRIAVVGALSLGSSSLAQTIQVPDWENSVRFDLVASQEPVRPGDRLELGVVAEIDPGYHLYGPEERKPSRTEVSVEASLIESGQPIFPPVVRRDLAGLGEYDLYEGTIAIRIPISVADGAAGEREVPVAVRVNYQVCTDTACSAPTHRTLTLPLPVAEKGAAVQATHPEIFGSEE